MDKLNLLKLFLTVVDSGNYSTAAKQLAASPSTVSKAITRLENAIGIQLFQRSTRQLRLTPEGSQYAVKVRSLLEQLENCESNIKRHNDIPQGSLKISIPVSYGRLYIRPMLVHFQKVYPHISFELSYDDRYVDIIERGFDICIRSGPLTDSRLIARQLSPIDFLICASKSYLKKHPRPNSAREFDKHDWIRFRFQQTGRLLPIMMPGRSSHREYDPNQQYIVDDGEALAELCADGLGLSQMPHFIAKNFLEDESIFPLFPPFHPRGYGVFLLYPKREYLPERVSVFIKFISQYVENLGETPRSTWAKDLVLW